MKVVISTMNGNSEKIPLDYHIKEMLRIYAKRLIMFFIIVVGNLVLLVYLVGLSMWPIVFSFISILAAATILSLFLFLVRGEKKPRAAVEIQFSGLRFLEEAKKWLGEITEIALLLVALGIVIDLFFGTAIPFFGGGIVEKLTAHLTTLLNTLGENGLAGLIALSIIAYLFHRTQKKRT